MTEHYWINTRRTDGVGEKYRQMLARKGKIAAGKAPAKPPCNCKGNKQQKGAGPKAQKFR